MPNKFEACDLYKQVSAFVKSAQVVYIFPTALSFIFWSFFEVHKSKVPYDLFKYPLNRTRTVFIDLLKSFCSCERWLPSKRL